MKNTSNLINSVLHGGLGVATQHSPQPFGMPPFLLTLDDTKTATVLPYVRNAWGNSADNIQQNDVARQRGGNAR